MSFTIKVRGAPPPTAIADYYCEEHGRFELQVKRNDQGDPPETVPCPAFHCDACAGCGKPAVYCISAPLARVKAVSVTQGKYQKPERKTWLDTRELGEGMPLEEWQAKRAAIRDEQRRKELKELMS